MNSPVNIREFRFPHDYEETLQLWMGIGPGVKVGRSDTADEIRKKITRDPDLFLLAEIKGQIVGSIMGGFDGRRGMIYHLAVRADLRNHGVATLLMEEVEKRLQARGCIKCYLLVFADNTEAIQFYENRGWREMKEDRIYGKEFS
jgi:ribosomal protein S18 acetylase RimI-like enzyme